MALKCSYCGSRVYGAGLTCTECGTIATTHDEVIPVSGPAPFTPTHPESTPTPTVTTTMSLPFSCSACGSSTNTLFGWQNYCRTCAERLGASTASFGPGGYRVAYTRYNPTMESLEPAKIGAGVASPADGSEGPARAGSAATPEPAPGGSGAESRSSETEVSAADSGAVCCYCRRSLPPTEKVGRRQCADVGFDYRKCWDDFQARVAADDKARDERSARVCGCLKCEIPIPDELLEPGPGPKTGTGALDVLLEERHGDDRPEIPGFPFCPVCSHRFTSVEEKMAHYRRCGAPAVLSRYELAAMTVCGVLGAVVGRLGMMWAGY